MDLTSLPGSPYTLKDRQVTEARIALAKAADLLRMEGRLVRAEALYRQACRYADGGAFDHLVRLADHCRTQYEAQKRAKARKSAKKGGR
jgi:hypothetical protein